MTTFADNRKAHFNYEFLEEFEAGIELLGFEVKSIRAGRFSLDGSHVTVRGGEAFLIGANCTPLQPKNIPSDYDARRHRKLLLSKNEIAELAGNEAKKGLTIVPISVYNKGRRIKVRIAIARGKRQFDKRASIQKREVDRDIERTLKGE
jgi:SsrA-binding protein